jgi:prephenate dehydrogenase
MWQPILERAPAATLEGLRVLESNVHRLRVAIEEKNWTDLRELWESARQWRVAAEQGEST